MWLITGQKAGWTFWNGGSGKGVALQMENFTADPQNTLPLFFFQAALETQHSTVFDHPPLHAFSAPASVLCHSWIWGSLRPSPYSAFPTVAHLGFCFSTPAKFDFSVNLILSAVISYRNSSKFFYRMIAAIPVFWLFKGFITFIFLLSFPWNLEWHASQTQGSAHPDCGLSVPYTFHRQGCTQASVSRLSSFVPLPHNFNNSSSYYIECLLCAIHHVRADFVVLSFCSRCVPGKHCSL